VEGIHRISRWSLILSLLFAAAFLYLAFHGASWEGMVGTARQGRMSLLILSFFLQSLSYIVRGWRWHVLLRIEKYISPLIVFWAMMIGYVGNNFLPARAGELIRSAMIGRSAQISKTYALATIFTERLIDMAVLVLICLGMLIFLKEMPGWLASALPILGVVVLAGLAALFFIPRHEHWLKTWLPSVLLPESLRDPASQLLGKFFIGLHIFQHPSQALRFLGLTLMIWLIDSWVAIEVASAFNLTLTFMGALLLLGGLGLASMIPSTPGSIGIFQFVAVTVLVLFNFTRSEALVYIIALQAVVYAVVTVGGLIGLWRLGVHGKNAGL
jgi:glycosyltransferase 2 family protein